MSLFWTLDLALDIERAASATYRHNWRADGVLRRNVWRPVDNRFFLRLVIDLVDTAVDSSRGASRLLANHRSYGCDASLGSPSPSPVSRHPSTPTATSSSSTPSSASSSADPPRTLLRGILSQQPGVPLGLNLHALQPGHPALRPAATNGSNGEYHHHHHGHPNPHGKPGKAPFTGHGMIRPDGGRSCCLRFLWGGGGGHGVWDEQEMKCQQIRS